MKSTPSPRFPLSKNRLFLLTLVSLVAASALLSLAVSANRANRAAKARTEQSANAKSAINPLQDKQPDAPNAAVIVATLSDNTAAATKVAPGVTINYTATIANNGATSPADDATNLSFSAPLDANTTLVGGSVHASPIALNDTYNWVGNTQLDTVARALPVVTANDVAVNAPAGTDTFTVTAIAGGATALGGVVTLASPAGSFVYTPPVGRPNIADGATVQDSFTYTITNSADPTLTSTGTVRINLTGRVWYLQAGAAGDGRSNTPSSSPSAMSTAADKTTDIFYIFSNAGSLNGPFSIDAGQQLLGQGVNLVVSAITLFNAAAPTPTTTNTAGSCVALAGAPGNNTLSGFNIGNCTGGTAITGANVGTLNVSTMSISTNGGALDLTGVGAPTVSVVLGGTTSTGGAKNVNLVGLNGTFTLANGALSGATGNAFDVSGGTATITYLGTISNSGAKQVNIANTTGGSATFDGAVNGTGTGINLATNTGKTITFRGGVVLSTGANTAFGATGGGTVNVCDENPCNPAVTGALVNTLTTTTGTALNVVSTTIGANKLEFRSISANGGTNGIVLNTTGAGGLTVNGTGTTDGSGGTIQSTTNRGASFISASNITLKNMNFTNAGTTDLDADNSGLSIGDNLATNAAIHLVTVTTVTLNNLSISGGAEQGINGNAVSAFTLSNSDITNVGNAADEDNVHFYNMSGTSAITNTILTHTSGGGDDNLNLQTTSGTLILTISGGSAVGTGGGVNQLGSGYLFGIRGTSNATINLSSASSTSNFSGGIVADAFDTALMDLNVTNSTSSGNNDQLSVSAGDSSSVDLVATGNTLSSPAAADFVVISLLGSAFDTGYTLDANISGNTITVGNGLPADGIIVNNAGGGAIRATITTNTIDYAGSQRAIIAQAGQDGNGSSNLTITGNNIDVKLDGAGNAVTGILAQTAITGPGNTSSMCADIGGAGALSNTFTHSLGGVMAGGDIRVRQRNDGTFRLPGYGGAATDTAAVITYLNGRNLEVSSSTATADSSGFAGGAACIQPTTIPNPGDSTLRNHRTEQGSDSVARAESSPKQPILKNLETAVPVKQTTSRGNSWVTGKATPQASAAEVARIYRSERPISHHAILKNAFSQEPKAPLAAENVTLNTIATFPAGGKSITIKYSATVNTTVLTARQASTQGTITANGGAINVQTDDPDVGGTQATVTLLDTTLTWSGATNTDWNTATNWNRPGPAVSSYAPGVSNPAVNDVIIPNVGAQPTINATDIGIYSLNIFNGRTLTITNPRVLTIGGSPGGDLTLNGIISGGFLNLGTGTHVINNAGGTGSLSSTNVATVLSGGVVTLNNNLQAGGLGVNAGGSMTIATRTLSLNGTGGLVVPGGATFTTTGSTVIFNGTAAQQAAGIAYNNLTINNTAAGAPNALGATLAGNATVNGVLALTSNDLNTGGFTLTQPNTTASTGVSDVVGTVTRSGGPFGLISLTFGNPNNIITFTGAGTRPTTMTVVMAKAAPATYAAAVQRNYTISQTGGSLFTATVRLHYLDTELNGNTPEANLGLRRFRAADSHWVAAPPPPGVPTRDGTANWIEATGVLAADLTTQWTFSTLAPTASGGTVTGRIVDDNGNAVEGAVVRLNGTQNRKFITDANGYYRFDNVETNGFYTVTPSRANYSFTPSVRSFSQIGESTEAAFGATLTTSTLANPLDTPEYFVRQHYIDFLNREPDEAGFNFWSEQIIECGTDQNCIERRRENVSAAYFLSIEFQRTGGLVDGLYRAAYGVRPDFAHFLPDTRTVGNGVRVGIDGWEALLATNTEAFVNSFVNRAEFHTAYDNLSDSQYVDTLISHTGVSFTAAERDALLSGLGTGAMTRAQALRSIAEDGRFVSAKFNETFVMMEYFGYLRRDPDANGFAFWLNKLNQFNGNFEQAEMVKAFIVSGEYRDRFPR